MADYLPKGSSPLTRGKSATGDHLHPDSGLIPAHAGKISRRSSTDRDNGAHPRSRGENLPRAEPRVWTQGSSPLTRGKYKPTLCWASGGGLIPAHAGKIWISESSRPRAWAHPRSRGENRGRHRRHPQNRGSSPLTRGKYSPAPGRWPHTRLIPAHAGKIPAIGRRSFRRRAHPRSRGENASARRSNPSTPGSSPLTRGKSCPMSRGQPRERLIPAHAGKILPDLRFYRADRSDLGKP